MKLLMVLVNNAEQVRLAMAILKSSRSDSFTVVLSIEHGCSSQYLFIDVGELALEVLTDSEFERRERHRRLVDNTQLSCGNRISR